MGALAKRPRMTSPATTTPSADPTGISSASIDRLRRIGVVWAVIALASYLLDASRQTRLGLTNGALRPLGDDFINYWSGGRLTLIGRAHDVYNGPAYHAFQQAAVRGPIQAYHFGYPPLALPMLAPLGLVPYLPALALWLGLSAAAFWLALRPVAGRGALLLALATPALFVNAVGGQNGAWTAALLGGGLCLLDRRPLVAGLLFGLLVYKPHLGPMIPIALIAGGRWRTVGAAGLTAAGLLGLSLALFGPQAWSDYSHAVDMMRRLELEDGGGVWFRMVSVFVMVRRLGGPVPLAYAVQAISALFAAGMVAWLWGRNAAPGLRNAGLIVGACLATPYLQDYDLVVLAFAAAWIAGPALTGAVRERGPLVAAGLLMALPIIAAPLGKLTGLSFGALFFIPAAAVILRNAQQPRTVLAATGAQPDPA
jgi:arabinofuranan 3-O-arabinosyltransferase